VLLALVLLRQNHPFQVKVVLLLQNLVKTGISTPINTDLLPLVPEVILDRLFGFFLCAVELPSNNVVLPLQRESIGDKVFAFKHVSFQHELDALFRINVIVALLDIHGDKVELRLADFLPPFHEPFILVHDVIVVEDSKSVLLTEHLCLQILQHHMHRIQFLIRRHRPMTMRNLPIKSHDRAESLSLRHKSQLSWSEIIRLTLSVHFLLFHCFKRLFQQIFNRKSHYHRPHSLPVVKYPRIILLLLSSVEITSQQRHNQLLKHPLQNAPENPIILVSEVLDMLFVALVAEPAHFVGVEAVEELDSGEGFEAVEADEG
jgi:hypothetical protein